MARKSRATIGFFDKVLNTIKKNWYLIVIGVLTVVIFVITYIHGGKLSGLINSLGNLSENYRKQVKSIDKLSEKKTDKDKKVLNNSKKTLKQIEDKEVEKLANVEKEKKQTLETLKKKKSKELAQKMKDEFKI